MDEKADRKTNNETINAGGITLSLDQFSKNPILYLILVLVLGSSGLDINASNKQTEAMHTQAAEIQAIRYEVNTIGMKIVDHSERISRNEDQIDEIHDQVSRMQYQMSLSDLKIIALQEEVKNDDR